MKNTAFLAFFLFLGVGMVFLFPSPFGNVSFMPAVSLDSIYSQDEAGVIAPIMETGRGKPTSALEVFPLEEDGHTRKYRVMPPVAGSAGFLISSDSAEKPNSAKDYYLTWTDKGSLFILFPQIGNEVYLFNEKGEYLWKTRETRYLQLFPDENWMMAVSGDHSRVGFLNYSFQEKISHEGFIMHSYNLGERGKYCLGFLDGSLYIGNLDAGTKGYFPQEKPTKKTSCNFNRKMVMTHGNYRNKESINIFRFLEKDNKINLTHLYSVSLAEIYEIVQDAYPSRMPLKSSFYHPDPIALSWHDSNFGIAVIHFRVEGKIVPVLALLDDAGVYATLPLQDFLKTVSFSDSWGIRKTQTGFIVFNNTIAFLVDNKGVYSIFRMGGNLQWTSTGNSHTGTFIRSKNPPLFIKYSFSEKH